MQVLTILYMIIYNNEMYKKTNVFNTQKHVWFENKFYNIYYLLSVTFIGLNGLLKRFHWAIHYEGKIVLFMLFTF